jgi:hypothetical protein
MRYPHGFRHAGDTFSHQSQGFVAQGLADQPLLRS